MANDEVIGTVIPHADFGDPECCGCLNGIIRGQQADIVCNECRNVVRSVPATNLRRALNEMELRLDLATAKCPYCGAVHVAPGFSELIAFKCDNCGQTAKLENDPNADVIFGE